VSEILLTDSVSRPKNGKNSTKNGQNAKNPLLQTKILKLLHGPIFTIWAQFFFLFLKMSSDSFKSTYKTKKKEKKNIFDVKLLTTNRTTVEDHIRKIINSLPLRSKLPRNFLLRLRSNNCYISIVVLLGDWGVRSPNKFRFHLPSLVVHRQIYRAI
jgi:hypothetical protein